MNTIIVLSIFVLFGLGAVIFYEIQDRKTTKHHKSE
jgi:hypothetical protein